MVQAKLDSQDRKDCCVDVLIDFNHVFFLIHHCLPKETVNHLKETKNKWTIVTKKWIKTCNELRKSYFVVVVVVVLVVVLVVVVVAAVVVVVDLLKMAFLLHTILGKPTMTAANLDVSHQLTAQTKEHKELKVGNIR